MIEYDYEYKGIIYDYQCDGMDLIWETKYGKNIPVKNLNESYMKMIINMIECGDLRNSKAWIEIFKDVIVKKRFEKINKIKNNIKK